MPFGGYIAAWPKGSELKIFEKLAAAGMLKKIKRAHQLEVYAPTKLGIDQLSQRQLRKCHYKVKRRLSLCPNIKTRYNHIDDYVFERQSPFYHHIPGKRICLTCWTNTKNHTCTCGNETEQIDPRARIPKRSAGKKDWQEFFSLFKPTVLTNPNWWKNRPLK